jgi:EmrB/QacA subfamily drug resistance transporter
MVASVMGPIDGSVINVAMPTLASAFRVDLSTVSWVSMAYLLVLGSLILTYGRLGDMYGYKRIFLLGVAIFTVASAACALSPSIWWLIVSRAVQAAGAGMFMAMSSAIITATFPPYERGRALGINGMIIAAGLALGPALGGLLLMVFSWHSIFLINLPIGLVSLYLIQRVIPEAAEHKRQSFDLTGATLGFIALSAVLLAASYGEEWGWVSPSTLALTGVFAVGLVAFIWWERRVPEPMLDLSLFKNPAFSAANFSALMNFIAQSSAIFVVPFYLQQVLRYSPQQAGLVLTVSPAIVLFTAPLSGSLSDRFGTRWLSAAGQGLVALGYVLLYTMPPGSSGVAIAWRFAFIGLGVGIFMSPNSSTVMGSCPRHRLGVGSGVLATVRNVGMVLGVAIATAVFTWRRTATLAALGEAGSFASGLRAAFLVAACLAAAGALVSSIRSDSWREAGLEPCPAPKD